MKETMSTRWRTVIVGFRNVALDAHGKSLSSALLELDVPEPDDDRAPAR